MKKLLFLTVTFIYLALFNAELAYSINEELGNFKLQQPNGINFTVRRVQDEYGIYNFTKYGWVVKNEEDGYFYYEQWSENGVLLPSSYKVGIDEPNKESVLSNIAYESDIKFRKRAASIRRNTTSNFNGVGKGARTNALPGLPDSLIVILVEFKNNVLHRTSPDAYTTAEFQDMLFATGNYTHPEGHTTYGSLRKYYRDMSGYPNGGYYDLVGRVGNSSTSGIPTWVQLNKTKAQFDSGLFTDFLDSVFVSAAREGIDTTRNNDRVIAIIYAGNMGGSTLIPQTSDDNHCYIMSERFKHMKGTESDSANFAHIGAHAHEFGHLIGFEDQYETETYNQWGLMADGSNNGIHAYQAPEYDRGSCPSPICPQYRIRLNQGWLSVTSTIGSPVSNQQIVYDANFEDTDIIKVQATNSNGTQSSTEYFLLENRQIGSGWNTYPSIDSGNDGLLIWHINEVTISGDDIGDNIDLIEADGSNTSASQHLDAFRSGDNTVLTDYTSPNARLFDTGYPSNVVITGISSSGTTMTANISPYWAGNLYDSITWTSIGNRYIGDTFTIPSSKTLTISGGNVYIAENEKIEVEGTLNINDAWTHFYRRSGCNSYWGGIDIKSTGRMNVTNKMNISYANTGITINNTNGIVFPESYLTIIQNCYNWGMYFNNCSPDSIRSINFNNNGTHETYYGAIYLNGAPSSPIIKHITIDGSSTRYGIYSGYETDFTMSNSIIDDVVQKDCIYLYDESGSADIDYRYNNILDPDPDGTVHYAIRSNSSGLYVRNNYWNDDTIDATKIFYPSNYFTYTPYATSAFASDSTGAPSPKITVPEEINPFIYVQGLEEAGDLQRAKSAYFNIISQSEKVPYKKMAIKSLFRVYQRMNGDFADIRNIIETELPKSESWYRDLLEFLWCETLIYEGKYNESIDAFSQKVSEFRGKKMELEILSRIATIYGDFLHNKEKAKEYADRVAMIDPSWGGLYAAYNSADIFYDPFAYKIAVPPEPIIIEPIPEQEETAEAVKQFVSVNPNPANIATTIAFGIKEPSHVKLFVYSITGQKVATLVDNQMSAGTHSAVFDGSDFASGVYFYRLESKGFTKTGKMLIVK